MNHAGGLITTLTDLSFDDDMTGRDAFDTMQALLVLRNLIDHHTAVVAGILDRTGVATDHGRTLRELLITMGFAPAVASRTIRIAEADLPTVDAHAADGAIPAEHVDAIVTGIAHIERRRAEPLTDETRHNYATELLSHHFSGATPANINATARTLGNDAADNSDTGLPAAEDRTSNTLDIAPTTDGRIKVTADIDIVIGEKLRTAIDHYANPRPQPNGAPDPRTASRRRADALELLLDMATHGESVDLEVPLPPKVLVALTIPADTPTLASLQFFGSITPATARALSCDSTVTPILIDGETVPLHMGRDTRFFNRAQRRALHLRDECCVKCGAPATWTHAHHITHWANGGHTNTNNGCLLCPSCHDDIHHHGWQVFLGPDAHPWLRPPTTIDPHQHPIPAYNRRGTQIHELPHTA